MTRQDWDCLVSQRQDYPCLSLTGKWWILCTIGKTFSSAIQQAKRDVSHNPGPTVTPRTVVKWKISFDSGNNSRACSKTVRKTNALQHISVSLAYNRVNNHYYGPSRLKKSILKIFIPVKLVFIKAEPVFENLLRIPGSDSELGGRVRHPFVVPYRLHRLQNRFLGSINVYKYGLSLFLYKNETRGQYPNS